MVDTSFLPPKRISLYLTYEELKRVGEALNIGRGDSLYLTYEELKRAYDLEHILQYIPPVCILPMRN